MPKTCPVCSTTYPDSDAFCPKDGTTLLMDEAASSLVGSVIADRYLVTKLLGEGGMGQVYLAGHVRLPQQAAIKVLHASMVQDPGAIARFNREAANAARIEHERVARVFDFGETNKGLVYLAMEFVPGRTLREVLEETGRLEPQRAANIVYQVAEGLDAAHRISIVHRDLKPDNILVVSDEPGVDRCKVVDFGIAKAFDDSESRKTQLTQVGAIIGTPEYMSPEQVLGEQLDARSDVYALAVVAYHLLTGQLPFSAATPERSLTARLISDPTPLAEAAPDVLWPDSMQTAFDRALSREPDTRTSSALQFAEELIAATEGWTGHMVLRGRTPASNASLSTARTAAIPNAGGAVAAMRSAPTLEVNVKAATDKAASAKATGKAAAAQPASATAASTAASPGVASHATGQAGSAPNRTPMLIGALVVVAAIVGGVMMMGGGESAGDGASTVAAVSSTPDVSGSPATASQSAAPSAAGTPSGSAVSPGQTGSAASNASGPQPGAQPGAGTTTPPVVSSASQANAPATDPSAAAAVAEAQRELRAIQDRLSNAPDDEAALAAVGRAEIPRLERLLPRFTTVVDSVWVYVWLTQASHAANEPVKKCSALRTANRLATSPAQVEMVMNLKSMFGAECL
jgi:serine/threonine-protein kinase